MTTDGTIANAKCHWPTCCFLPELCAEHCIKRQDDEMKAFGNGRLTNCFVKAREDQKGPMFKGHADNVSVIANLDGYAIVPKEEYFALAGIEPEQDPEAAQERANKALIDVMGGPLTFR